MSRRSWTLLLALGAIWGASYLLIKIGIRDLTPGMVAWARIALGAAVLIGVAWRRGAMSGFRGRAGLILLVGASQVAGPFLLIAAAEQEISSSLAGILVTSAPLFTALLAIWIDREERMQGPRLVGVLLGVTGVVILLGFDLEGTGGELIGALAVLLAGLGYAVGGFIVKHRFSDRPAIGVAAWMLLAGALVLAPVAVIAAPAAPPGAGPVAAVIALGVLGTGIAFTIFYELIATVGPGRAFTVTYVAPGFAVVYGALLLDEAVTVATLVGLALILAGSWLAAGGRLTLPRRAPSGSAAALGGKPPQ